MSKSIFISCVHEDSGYIDILENWARQGLLGNVIITKETEDKRQHGRDAIRQHIKAKIQGAAFVFVLIGDNTHNHDWITVEVELANSFNKEVICVRIPNTSGGLPSILSGKRTIDFDRSTIIKLIAN